jgi:hypothetical protein
MKSSARSSLGANSTSPISALISDTWWRAVGKRRNIWAKLAHAFLPWQAMLLLRLGRHLGPFSSFNDRQDLSLFA